MVEKIARYRKLVHSLAAFGDEHAKAITSNRYKLMYHYFVRSVSLASGMIVLIEAENLGAAYALQKSLVDAALNGLYFGYVAEEKEVEETIALALQGRGTGYSRMRARARKIDADFSKRRVYMSGMFEDMVNKTSEQLNEFGHGGLLSTALELKNLPPEVAYKLLSQSVMLLIGFVGNVAVLENLDLTEVEAMLKEFQTTNDDLVPLTRLM